MVGGKYATNAAREPSVTTFVTCRKCASRRVVPDEGTTPIVQSTDGWLAFVRVADKCMTCGERRVRIDMRQFDQEQPAVPDRA